MVDQSTTAGRDDGVHVRVLLPDGGEEEAPEEEDETEESDEQADAEDGADSEGESAEGTEDEEDDETEEGDEQADAEGENEDDQTEDNETGDEEESDREESESEEGTRVLHLNLDGLFLDLLGLEVDLDEVTLDITAIPGGGNLLGNLLSAVGGLLDGGDLGSLLGLDDLLGGGLLGGDDEDGGLLGEDGLLGGDDGDQEGEDGDGSSGLLPDLALGERIAAFGSAIAERLRSFFGSILDELPLEELATQFVQELVNQLLGADDSDDSDNGDAASA
ncbi:hypothetical protein [Halalkalicoccus jeotgali]|uniref:Uncharacterized protein n=1 Tax=Halalkalicoccus jeotgali (strain DSM 18796 / CECT 7217 / JCM 14584 / KCTC 4019 / B3) TaxID=795797 RepID=D8J5N6_HALJB|nr:hypothetical protein [Halalkalicoccus jeotgali]ADJ15732.1 hypothetical protein HacjB3_11745 [Halalkalicoccus jeotgali B3]ELY37244.1 hypothetical protein C497_10883 [Halalkalicoccus jeotgali B3]